MDEPFYISDIVADAIINNKELENKCNKYYHLYIMLFLYCAYMYNNAIDFKFVYELESEIRYFLDKLGGDYYEDSYSDERSDNSWDSVTHDHYHVTTIIYKHFVIKIFCDSWSGVNNNPDYGLAKDIILEYKYYKKTVFSGREYWKIQRIITECILLFFRILANNKMTWKKCKLSFFKNNSIRRLYLI